MAVLIQPRDTGLGCSEVDADRLGLFHQDSFRRLSPASHYVIMLPVSLFHNYEKSTVVSAENMFTGRKTAESDGRR